MVHPVWSDELRPDTRLPAGKKSLEHVIARELKETGMSGLQSAAVAVRIANKIRRSQAEVSA